MPSGILIIIYKITEKTGFLYLRKQQEKKNTHCITHIRTMRFTATAFLLKVSCLFYLCQYGFVSAKNASGEHKPDITTENYVDGIKFILQTESSVGLKWNFQPWQKSYNITIKPDHHGITKKTIDANHEDGTGANTNLLKNSVLFEGLYPANNYWITINAEKRLSGEYSKSSTIRVFTAPAPPKNVKMVDFNEESTTISWENPNIHRHAAFAVARLNRAPRKIRVQSNIDQENNKLVISNMPPGTSYDCTIFYVFNKRRSDSFVIRVTRQPKPVESVEVDKMRIQDKGKAALEVSWAWPDSYWGSVKITVSPPVEGQRSEWWITDRKIPVKM